MNAERALEELKGFIETYQTLTEREKFSLARFFQETTGGKLSPFNSPSPVCVGVIPVNGPGGEVGFLGVRRAIPPCIGEVALAGGFLGANEDPIACVVREIQEETGIVMDPGAFVSSNVAKMGHNNNLLMFLTSQEVLSFEMLQEGNRNLHETDGEASELVFITPDTALCFPLHQEAVNIAFEEYGSTPHIQPNKSFKL